MNDYKPTLTDQEFWEIINTIPDNSNITENVFPEAEEQILKIYEILSKLPKDKLYDFYHIHTQYYHKLYNHNVWGIAFLQLGGCSDDSFMDYRGWLIFQGKEQVELALNTPDELHKLVYKWGEEGGLEGYNYIIPELFQHLYKEEPTINLEHPSEPSGEPWEDEDELYKKYPKSAKASDEAFGRND